MAPFLESVKTPRTFIENCRPATIYRTRRIHDQPFTLGATNTTICSSRGAEPSRSRTTRIHRRRAASSRWPRVSFISGPQRDLVFVVDGSGRDRSRADSGLRRYAIGADKLAGTREPPRVVAGDQSSLATTSIALALTSDREQSSSGFGHRLLVGRPRRQRRMVWAGAGRRYHCDA